MTSKDAEFLEQIEKCNILEFDQAIKKTITIHREKVTNKIQKEGIKI